MRKIAIILLGSSGLALGGCVSVAEGLAGVAAALEAQNAQAGSLNLPSSYYENGGTTGSTAGPIKYCDGQTPSNTPPTPGSVCPQ